MLSRISILPNFPYFSKFLNVLSMTPKQILCASDFHHYQQHHLLTLNDLLPFPRTFSYLSTSWTRLIAMCRPGLNGHSSCFCQCVSRAAKQASPIRKAG